MAEYDVVVVGGGSAGCVLAARLSERPGRRVLLLEAGPDYPTVADLPPDVADGRTVAESHDWGYASEPDAAGRSLSLLRGRLTGGCSALNATFAPRGFRSDYDAWAEMGNAGWSFEEVLPFFCRAETDLDFGDQEWHGRDGPVPIRRYPEPERTEFAQGVLDAAVVTGHAPVDDHNRPDALGAGPTPSNTRDGVRMSTAMTYLVGARGRPNFSIRPDAPVDRVEVRDGRAAGMRLADGEIIDAGVVVLSAGAYGSPAVLLRSGIGPPDHLREVGVEPVVPLGGVGRSLVDHPIASVDLALHTEAGNGPRFQALVTWRSTAVDPGHDCDMHIFPSGPYPLADGPGSVGAIVFSVVKPKSHGELRLRSPDPADAPRIRLAHLEDPVDMERMLEALVAARGLARAPSVQKLVAPEELSPAPGVADDDRTGLTAALRASVNTYHHPVGTCSMGPDPDDGAVVDARGNVYGVDNLVVADASVMPEIPAANTNIPTIMVAERIAAWLDETT